MLSAAKRLAPNFKARSFAALKMTAWHRCDSIRTMIIRLLIAVSFFPILGCSANQPTNPSFPVDANQAQRALAYMSSHPHRLERPLLIVGGFMDPNVSPPIYKWQFHRLTNDDRIATASIALCGSFDECRAALIDAVDRAFPNDDPEFTTEVDVIGASLGGLAARYAAAPSPDPAKPQRRLRIARLFSIASPHAGATLAASFGFTQYHRDMRPGSEFLQRLAGSDQAATYEVYPYVLLGDGIVGDQYAAPPHQSPIWLPTPPLQLAHVAAMSDPRILADIAKRLRGEHPFSNLPGSPLPDF